MMGDSGEEIGQPAAPAPATSVWARIKDHKIAQWALAYAAAAYALLDGTKLVSDTFEWPHLVARIVTVLLFLGLPLVVTLAWYHGHRALRRVSGAELTIITVLLVVAGAVLWRFAHAPTEAISTTAVSAHPAPTRPNSAISDKSVAVLPFADMSEKHDQESFADGMAEDILDLLGEVPRLKVIGRTSSFQFKGKNEDLRAIGAKLNAAYVLEGSLSKSFDKIRVAAQLIDARTGVRLWSHIYNRDVGDVLTLRGEIAAAVCQALRVVLSTDLPTRSSAKSFDAYRMYLEGRFFGRHQTKADSDRAISAYRGALALDPGYAPAWASLASELSSQWALYGGDLQAISAAAKRSCAACYRPGPSSLGWPFGDGPEQSRS